jgi:hypothetical protein
MSNGLRCLTNAEIDSVAGGFIAILLAALSACKGCTDVATEGDHHAGETGGAPPDTGSAPEDTGK